MPIAVDRRNSSNVRATCAELLEAHLYKTPAGNRVVARIGFWQDAADLAAGYDPVWSATVEWPAEALEAAGISLDVTTILAPAVAAYLQAGG